MKRALFQPPDDIAHMHGPEYFESYQDAVFFTSGLDALVLGERFFVES